MKEFKFTYEETKRGPYVLISDGVLADNDEEGVEVLSMTKNKNTESEQFIVLTGNVIAVSKVRARTLLSETFDPTT